MTETKNQEWNISQTAPQSFNFEESTTNEWNLAQPATTAQPSVPPPTSQQWNLEAQQWNINQPEATQKEQKETKEQWSTSEAVAQLESSPPPPSGALWDAVQPDPIPRSTEATSQQWSIEKPLTQEVIPPQKDAMPLTPPQPSATQQTVQQRQTTVSEQPSSQSVSKAAEKSANKQAMTKEENVQAKPPVIPEEKPTTTHQVKDAPQTMSQEETVVPKQPLPPPATEPVGTKQPATTQETVAQPSPPKEPVVATQTLATQPVIPKQAAAPPHETVGRPTPPEEPVAATQHIVRQPEIQKQTAAPSQEPVAHPALPKEPVVVTQQMAAQPVVAPQETVTRPVTSQTPVIQTTAPQQPKASQVPAVQPVPHTQKPAPKQTVVQQITPKKTPLQIKPVVQSTTQISMPPNTSQQRAVQTTQQSAVSQPKQPMVAQSEVARPIAAQATPPPESIPPEAKPKPSTNKQGPMRTEVGDEIALEELRKGVFWIGPDLEGWVDKTKALKEEFRRQSIANEMYFVKNLPQLDIKTLNISDDPSKYIYNVRDLKGVEVVNLLRCVINEYREYEAGPFFFQFAEDKKFKLELLPTATQPGNGLIKTVGRLKYYTYPDMCSMLKTAGVTSKGLGIMLQKLNTSGLKSALNNKISPMNELHFMLLFEVARRLVRGPHGFSMAIEPEIDQLPIGVAVSRMITMFCEGNYCLNYEAVFGTQDKYNPFVDTSVVLRRQKIYALNKLFYDAEIRPQAGDNPFLAKFLKYYNGYIIKTINGYMEELDMAFRGF